MKKNRFQGDPSVKITPDGAKMKFISGQPEMDQGLENAAQISLFTKKGWWGNSVFVKEENKIGSDFETATQKPIVAIQTLNDIIDAASKALAWMKSSKVASKIEVTATNPNANNIRMKAIITPPGQDIQELLFLKNGVNWLAQAQNPAHERLKNI